MRLFQKRRKFGNFRGPPVDAEPLPDVVYQMGAEAAAQYVRLRASSPNPHDRLESAASGIVYSLPHASGDGGQYPEEQYFYDQEPYQEYNGVARSSSMDFLASALGLGSSKSRQERVSRPKDRFVPVGSPVHFQDHPPGTPVKYRRRPASPELAQQRVGSPLHFAHNSRPSSPDVMRRLHRAQLSQDLQYAEHQQRQQQQQQQLMMANAIPVMPQYPYAHQPYYPMVNQNMDMHSFPILQAPQMYSYY